MPSCACFAKCDVLENLILLYLITDSFLTGSPWAKNACSFLTVASDGAISTGDVGATLSVKPQISLNNDKVSGTILKVIYLVIKCLSLSFTKKLVTY